MRRSALLSLLVVVLGCGAVTPRPVSLPRPDAPLEQRVAAYRALQPRLYGAGFAQQVRIGDRPGRMRLSEARPWIANSPHARQLLSEFDRWSRPGNVLLAVGLGGLVAEMIVTMIGLEVPSIGNSVADHFGVWIASAAILGAVGIVGAILVGEASRRVPRAVDAYDAWLWEQLSLPRASQSFESGVVPQPVAPATLPGDPPAQI